MRSIIYSIAKHYRKHIDTSQYPKSLNGWKQRDKDKQKFLNAIFKIDREEFINSYSTILQSGRIRYCLNACYDSTRMSYFHAIENYFLHGWWYDYSILNDGSKFESMYKLDCSTKGLTTNTSLQYAKFLTEKYGKELFIKHKIA